MDNRIWQLVSRKLSGEASLDELRELENLIQEDSELSYQVHLYTLYFKNPPKTRDENKKAIAAENFRKRLSEAENSSVVVRKLSPLYKWLAVAGVLLLFFTSYLLFNRKPDTEADRQVFANKLKTMPGIRSKTILPDGSTIWLNSESNITYNSNFGVDKREVYLVGEAFFEVEENINVPFIVHAQTVKIRVTGTAFNVRSYPENNKVQTALIRGSVEVFTEDNPDQAIKLKPNEKVTISTIKPLNSNKATAPPAQLESIKRTADQEIPEISWVNDRLVFDNELFTDVIDKLEKWYNIEVQVKNPNIQSKRFSGHFENEDFKQALEALQYVHHFDFEIKGRTIIIK